MGYGRSRMWEATDIDSFEDFLSMVAEMEHGPYEIGLQGRLKRSDQIRLFR